MQAFKKRNEDVRRKVATLTEAPATVDFAQYRSVLKNQAVVNEIEASFKAFKPVTYDVSKTLDAITKFEAAAIKNAEETKGVVDAELKALNATLDNIAGARPFDELTVDELAAAEPSIDKRTTDMVTKGRWMVPGYKVRFIRGVRGCRGANMRCRRNSVIFLCCNRLNAKHWRYGGADVRALCKSEGDVRTINFLLMKMSGQGLVMRCVVTRKLYQNILLGHRVLCSLFCKNHVHCSCPPALHHRSCWKPRYCIGNHISHVTGHRGGRGHTERNVTDHLEGVQK